MNPKTLVAATVLLFILSCGQNNQKAAEEQMLTEFYTLYITANAKMPPDIKAIDAIEKRYLSNELREKLLTAEYHADPFLNTQEYSMDWIESLEISQVEGATSVFKVCYDYSPGHRNCVTLYLVKTDGHYLINDIEGLAYSDADNEVLTSPVRGGEQLEVGKIYTDDDFEYVEYNDQGDYFFFVVQRDDERMIFLDGYPAGSTLPVLNRGDRVEIQWKVDSSWVAGDGERLVMTEWATNIKKTEDGSLSLFKKKHPNPLPYQYDKEWAFTEGFLVRIREAVEYYLANTKQQRVRDVLDDPSANIGFSIEEQRRDGQLYYLIGIYNEFENHTNTFQWLYLSDNEWAKIFEYDLPNDKLIEFADW